MTLITPLEKGNALETAVRAIEERILESSPALRENTYVIESKKIVCVAGVHHEFDLFVTVDLGRGYKSVFVFECKNWENSVSKNEIIVFSEKIEAVQAQHGFFVAKSFTADAQAQAYQDPRITLLLAEEHDCLGIPVPFDFHFVLKEDVHADVQFLGYDSNESELESIDVNLACAKLQGNDISLNQYVTDWAQDASNESMSRFPSNKFPEGVHGHKAYSTREFAKGELSINGKDIGTATLNATFKVRVLRPAVISHYVVLSRGRVLSLAPVEIQGNLVQTRMISA